MMYEAVIGSHSGVYLLGDGQPRLLGLDGQRIWAIHAWRSNDGTPTILAGSYGDGIFRSDDGGKTWLPSNVGLTATALRTITPDPTQQGALLCGTEPGRIFRSLDGGRSWDELNGISALPAIEEWYLPYSPRAGAVRNIFSPPDGGQRLLASVEVGGLLDSRDAGETWSYVELNGEHDVHHITGHPDDPRLLYASVGFAKIKSGRLGAPAERPGGLLRSRDGGATWEKIQTGYVRATVIPPTRPDLLLTAPAPSVDRMGRIEVSADDGDTWSPAGNGIEIPMDDMVNLFEVAPDGSIWAVCAGGRLLQAKPGEWHWRTPLPAGNDLNVQSVTFVPRA